MSMIETKETQQFSYEAFAAHPFYTEINRSLVRQALTQLASRPINAQLTIVDMACGTGAVTRLIAEEVVRQGRRAHLIGVDPSAAMVYHAEENMQRIPGQISAEFIQGEATDLPHLVHDADAAFFCNAIHLVPDKPIAFEQMATILSSGGIFACNSAFYDGTYVEGSERIYFHWTRRAVRWLHKEHPEVHLSRDAKAMAMQWLTPKEYVALFKRSGFGSVDIVQTETIIPIQAMNDLAHYWLFIEGALPGAPLAYAAAALEFGLYQTGQELGMTGIPRMWLQLVATKK